MVPGGLSYSALLWLVVLSHLSPIAPHGTSPSPLLRLMLVRVVNFFFLLIFFFFPWVAGGGCAVQLPP